MIDAERVRTVLLRECSRRTRLLAEETRTRSHLIHREAERLRDSVRTAQIERYATCARLRVAGGSGPVDDVHASFARDIARELTPPLSSLWLRIEVMLAELGSGQPPTDVLNDLSVLGRLAGQLAAIVKGLSCLAPDSRLDVRSVDLDAFLVEAISPLIPRLARRGVVVRPDRGPAGLRILADVEALRYVVTSLVETVAETSPIVDVTARSAENGDICLDVGGGRKPEALYAITSRDAARLVIADAIVRNLGGSVEQHIGNPCTTFTITLRAVGEPSAGMRSAGVP